jgi:electron transfer flavoprotein beta subunit
MMQPERFYPELTICTLISTGKHPDSLRVRRAEQDARAVELALRISPDHSQVIHAGNPQEESLRSYAGMGLNRIRVLVQQDKTDVVPVLRDYLLLEKPDIILTGIRSESGESSGMVPYLLAEQLGCPLIAGIADIVSIQDGIAEVLQALPRGQRRSLKVNLPFVATVDMAAPEPRQSAFGPATRAQLEPLQPTIQTTDEVWANWTASPAKKRPKRLKVVKAKTAADRFKAATAKAQSTGGKVIRDQSTADMARAVFDLLLEEGVLR